MRQLLIVVTVSLATATASSQLLAGYSDAILADNPVGYWRFSETSDTQPIANSGSEGTLLDGTAYNGVYMGELGPQGSGFASGNASVAFAAGPNPPQYIEVVDPGTSSALDFAGGEAMTLEAWFYLPSPAPTTSVNYIMGKGRVTDPGATDQSYSMRFSPSGEFSMLFRTSDNAGWGKWSAPVGAAAFDTWHHIVFSHTWGTDLPGTGSGTGVYLDGQDITPQGTWNTVSGVPAEYFSPLVTDQPLWIGASQNSSAGAMTGWVDEVAIYHTALTAQQASAHYQAADYDGGSPLPEPINGLQNGNFESTDVPTFGYPWNDFATAFPVEEHVGLSPTGLASGTKAAYVTEAVQGSLSQEIAAEDSAWELGFLFATEQPETGRTMHFTVNHTDNPDNNMILMRIVNNGDLQAYKPGSSWTTLPGAGGIIDFSVDADADGSLDDAADTLNVYSVKIVGDYTGAPSYDVYLSDANSETMTLLAGGLDWFIGTVPEAGDSVTRLQFCQYQTPEAGASYIIDEAYFVSGATPEPLPGDANEDGTVDVSDLGILATNYGATSGMEWGDADFTGDGAVDVSDLGVLASNYGTSAAVASVPEPSLAILLLGMMLTVVVIHRR